MKVALVVGARPNFVKAAPILRELRARKHEALLVHTGQHYDDRLYLDMLRDLEMPHPTVSLGCSSAAGRSRFVMEAVIKLRWVFQEECPDWVVVVGDVNSTLAGALAAVKKGLPLAHVEAGLRSGDDRMVEEFNRHQVDALADQLFCTTPEAVKNLVREEVPGAVHHVGNTMIDTLVWAKGKIADRAEAIFGTYGVVTLHRAELVDDAMALGHALHALTEISRRIPLKFPAHPRTGIRPHLREGLEIVRPLPYLEFMALVQRARLVITDSGGLQEETTFLGIPCLTLRNSTERPETVTEGTNRLVALRDLPEAVEAALAQAVHPVEIPLWDGHAAERIVKVLEKETGCRVGAPLKK